MQLTMRNTRTETFPPLQFDRVFMALNWISIHIDWVPWEFHMCTHLQAVFTVQILLISCWSFGPFRPFLDSLGPIWPSLDTFRPILTFFYPFNFWNFSDQSESIKNWFRNISVHLVYFGLGILEFWKQLGSSDMDHGCSSRGHEFQTKLSCTPSFLYFY